MAPREPHSTQKINSPPHRSGWAPVASTPDAFSAVLCPTPGAGVWSLALGLKRSALDSISTFCARWTRRSAKYCESAVRATLGLIIRLGLGTATLEGICGGL